MLQEWGKWKQGHARAEFILRLTRGTVLAKLRKLAVKTWCLTGQGGYKNRSDFEGNNLG